jgi:FRG domain-containing protein
MTNLYKIYKIINWESFLSKVSGYSGTVSFGDWGFRGVPSESFDLIPSIGRKSSRPRYSSFWEQEIFDRFKQQAIPHLVQLPPNELTWLALARHHGLPTRLLDWTLSPLIAAYFAVSGARSGKTTPDNCAIYAYRSIGLDREENIRNPFSMRKKYVEVHVAHYSPRLAAQKGFFTAHRNPSKPFRPKTLHKLIIPGTLCEEFQDNLDFFGINSATLFPDLDGVAEYWGWYYKGAM